MFTAKIAGMPTMTSPAAMPIGLSSAPSTPYRLTVTRPMRAVRGGIAAATGAAAAAARG